MGWGLHSPRFSRVLMASYLPETHRNSEGIPDANRCLKTWPLTPRPPVIRTGWVPNPRVTLPGGKCFIFMDILQCGGRGEKARSSSAVILAGNSYKNCVQRTPTGVEDQLEKRDLRKPVLVGMLLLLGGFVPVAAQVGSAAKLASGQTPAERMQQYSDLAGAEDFV